MVLMGPNCVFRFVVICFLLPSCVSHTYFFILYYRCIIQCVFRNDFAPRSFWVIMQEDTEVFMAGIWLSFFSFTSEIVNFLVRDVITLPFSHVFSSTVCVSSLLDEPRNSSQAAIPTYPHHTHCEILSDWSGTELKWNICTSIIFSVLVTKDIGTERQLVREWS